MDSRDYIKYLIYGFLDFNHKLFKFNFTFIILMKYHIDEITKLYKLYKSNINCQSELY